MGEIDRAERAQPARRHRIGIARGFAERRHHAAPAQAFQRALEGRLADRIVDHRHAFAAGDLAHARGKILARVDDRMVAAVGAGDRGLLVARSPCRSRSRRDASPIGTRSGRPRRRRRGSGWCRPAAPCRRQRAACAPSCRGSSSRRPCARRCRPAGRAVAPSGRSAPPRRTPPACPHRRRGRRPRSPRPRARRRRSRRRSRARCRSETTSPHGCPCASARRGS